MANGIIRMQAVEKEYEKKLNEMILKKLIVDEKIDKLEEPYRSLLFYRYSRRMSWVEVARKIDYSLRDTYRKHGKALYLYSQL